MSQDASPKKLAKSLNLFDVYAISTGAMFSSGFFLLPGIATAYSGPSAVLAYLIAGILVLPAMFSQAELCTAMPKAGGTYYFLDRSLGPMAGTIGGLGTWLALVFKSAFALIGMGAYLVLFVDLPIKPVAVALTVAFTLLNVVGAKETSGLQRIFVVILVSILTFFVVQGVIEVFSMGMGEINEEQFTPFMPFGVQGLLSTIGLVFVSYAGLTKVASVAEEVEDPDRNIPLGMILSLATATFVYVVGVYIMVAVLDADQLRSDLTPVATAGAVFLDWFPHPEWLPQSIGVLLMVIAAIAAFASTGNAGILSASRYPLAMARDRLISKRFADIGRFGTPLPAVLVTSAAMIFFILVFSEQGVAKLASAFNLLVFGLLNLAVIVMRESRIASYAPGYRSPLYPWMQIFGILTALVLIAEIGMLSLVFTAAVIVACVAWYVYYAREKVVREGAIYHLFERLGRHRYKGLESELHAILEEKGTAKEAPFDRVVAESVVIDLEEAQLYDDIVCRVASELSERFPIEEERLCDRFRKMGENDRIPLSSGAALVHQRLSGVDTPRLALVRCEEGTCITFNVGGREEPEEITIYALLFLVSPADDPARHLQTLASIAGRIGEDGFMDEWLAADDEQQLKEAFLHHERHLALEVQSGTMTEEFDGKAVRDLSLPAHTLIALVQRNGRFVIPEGNTVIQEGDRLTVIGEPASIERLYALYGGKSRDKEETVKPR